METLATILQVTGFLIILVSILLCCACHFGGIIGTVIGFALAGAGEICHMDDDAKLELATATYQADGELLIIKLHQKSVSPIYNAAMEIKSNMDKIEKASSALEQKAKNVSNEHAKSIFKKKIDLLTRQKEKLNLSLRNLESCAFEQVLVKQMESTPDAELENAELTASIKGELDSMQQIMQEVENINKD